MARSGEVTDKGGAYVIMRLDRPSPDEISGTGAEFFERLLEEPRRWLTAKGWVPNEEEADAEVSRLNALNEPKGCFYYWLHARPMKRTTSRE